MLAENKTGWQLGAVFRKKKNHVFLMLPQKKRWIINTALQRWDSLWTSSPKTCCWYSGRVGLFFKHHKESWGDFSGGLCQHAGLNRTPDKARRPEVWCARGSGSREPGLPHFGWFSVLMCPPTPQKNLYQTLGLARKRWVEMPLFSPPRHPSHAVWSFLFAGTLSSLRRLYLTWRSSHDNKLPPLQPCKSACEGGVKPFKKKSRQKKHKNKLSRSFFFSCQQL